MPPPGSLKPYDVSTMRPRLPGATGAGSSAASSRSSAARFGRPRPANRSDSTRRARRSATGSGSASQSTLGREVAQRVAAERAAHGLLDLLQLAVALRLVAVVGAVAAQPHDRAAADVAECEGGGGAQPEVDVAGDRQRRLVAAARVVGGAAHGGGRRDDVVAAEEQHVEQRAATELAGRPVARLAAVGVDDDRVAVRDAGVGVRVEHGHRARQPVGQADVVVAELGDDLAARVVHQRVVRGHQADVVVEPHDAQARRRRTGRAPPASRAPTRCRPRRPRSRRTSARGSWPAPAPGRRAGHRSGTRSSPAASHPSSAVGAARLSGWRSLPIPARPMLIAHLCRACGAPLTQTFVDLGATPLANSYLEPADADRWSRTIRSTRGSAARACSSSCPPCRRPRRSSRDYAYFSSYSDSWVEHARRYVEAIVPALGLGPDSLVVEIASNDGYLLQHLVERGRPACSASSRPPTSPRRRSPPASTPRSRSSAALRRATSSAPRARRPHRRQQRARPRARPERLRRRHRRAAGAGRPRHDRGAAPAAPDRQASSTRSTTSTSPTCRCSPPRPRVAAPRPRGRRRRGAADARRLAALSTSRTPAPDRARRRASRRCGRRARGRPGSRSRRYRGFAEACADVKAGLLRLPRSSAPPDGPQGRRLRRPRQGQHAAQLLRRRAASCRLHRRPQPGQAGPASARLAHPGRTRRSTRAPTGPTTS